MKKDCPLISEEDNYYYIPMNMSKYHHEIYRKVDYAFFCLDLKNNKCQEALCNCDRKVAECWSALPNVPNLTICLSCYMDDARQFAYVHIKGLIDIQNLLNDQTDKADKIIMRGADNEELMVRMEVALYSIEQCHELIEKIDLSFNELFNETQARVIAYGKTAEEFMTQNRTTEAKAYVQLSNHKNTIINLAIFEYLKERKTTFSIIDKLHHYVHNLKNLLRL
ncbi:hypothetical protein Mgra_00007881 [Meloidogyne graminicola]|uniref:Uncharacterized protein n=1 Tax=Meloidogyne graminicola TaxID=189291 RepID=A0A8S9ZHH6_9BILA|nr:hypothetical protein Mgra_00007881 [Meloidogyne graminicola]